MTCPLPRAFSGLHILAQMTLNCIVGINVICLDNVKKHMKSFVLFCSENMCIFWTNAGRENQGASG